MNKPIEFCEFYEFKIANGVIDLPFVPDGQFQMTSTNFTMEITFDPMGSQTNALSCGYDCYKYFKLKDLDIATFRAIADDMEPFSTTGLEKLFKNLGKNLIIV